MCALPHAAFYKGAGDLNPDPNVFRASTLPTHFSPQLHFYAITVKWPLESFGGYAEHLGGK